MAEKKQRTPIPEDIAAQVQFLSDRTCCVCRKPGKPIQIHHIDENPSNNALDNLAVMCLACHDLTQIRGGFGRKLDAAQVKLYRDDWYRIVEEWRAAGLPTPPASASEPVNPEHLAPNPFGDIGRITDPTRFFDRKELLRQIFEELRKGCNVSLVGESQIGKSSVLSMVCIQGPERLNLPPEAFVYQSLQTVDDEDEFYEALCDALSIEKCRGFKLSHALQGKHYVLCLDEMEIMTEEEFGFTIRVRRHLRGLADGPDAPLKLVIASRSPLSRLFPDSPELDSPLAGICRQLDVGPFSPDVARAFLAYRLRGTGLSFDESEITLLLAESGSYPARLQRAAADLYRRKSG
jgi:hypothetical protein